MSALLDSLAASAGELTPARRAALESAVAEGLPTQRNEHWKYTSLRALGARSFAPAPNDVERCEVDEQLLAGIEAPRLVFFNGTLSRKYSDLGDALGLTRTKRQLEESTSDYANPEDVFSRLNFALSDTGATLIVRFDMPVTLNLLFIGAPSGADIASHNLHRIMVNPRAKLTLIEHHLSQGSHRNLDNHLLMLDIATGAEVLHARVQDASDGATLFARTDANVAEGASYRRVDLELGAALSRHELNVALAGRGASFRSSGALLAGGRRHVDTRLGVRHVVGETSCELLWRGLAAERGKLSFHGGIEIEAGADGSDASLSNKNLLLSPNAEIDTQPVLLIHADEVKAAHGATVGRLDERSLFYLRARGIPAAQARVMLTLAFLREVLAAANAPELIEALSPRLEARLATLEALA